MKQIESNMTGMRNRNEELVQALNIQDKKIKKIQGQISELMGQPLPSLDDVPLGMTDQDKKTLLKLMEKMI